MTIDEFIQNVLGVIVGGILLAAGALILYDLVYDLSTLVRRIV